MKTIFNTHIYIAMMMLCGCFPSAKKEDPSPSVDTYEEERAQRLAELAQSQADMEEDLAQRLAELAQSQADVEEDLKRQASQHAAQHARELERNRSNNEKEIEALSISLKSEVAKYKVQVNEVKKLKSSGTVVLKRAKYLKQQVANLRDKKILLSSAVDAAQRKYENENQNKHSHLYRYGQAGGSTGNVKRMGQRDSSEILKKSKINYEKCKNALDSAEREYSSSKRKLDSLRSEYEQKSKSAKAQKNHISELAGELKMLQESDAGST